MFQKCLIKQFFSPCADDGVLVFNSRGDLMLGRKIACLVMEKWGLTVHVGNDDKKSKTELILLPSSKTLKEWRKVPIGVDVDRDKSACQILTRRRNL